MTAVVDVVAADPCPECGYDRRGNAAGAACPECGHVQPADEFVAWGRSKSDTRSGWKTWLPFILIGPMMFVSSKVLPREFFESWGFAVIALLAVGGSFVWQRTRPRPVEGGPQQLRLSPRGFAVRTGFGPVEFKPWKPGHRLRVRETFFGASQVILEEPFAGPVVLERPLVFRCAPGEVGVVVGRVAALLTQA